MVKKAVLKIQPSIDDKELRKQEQKAKRSFRRIGKSLKNILKGGAVAGSIALLSGAIKKQSENLQKQVDRVDDLISRGRNLRDFARQNDLTTRQSESIFQASERAGLDRSTLSGLISEIVSQRDTLAKTGEIGTLSGLGDNKTVYEDFISTLKAFSKFEGENQRQRIQDVVGSRAGAKDIQYLLDQGIIGGLSNRYGATAGYNKGDKTLETTQIQSVKRLQGQQNKSYRQLTGQQDITRTKGLDANGNPIKESFRADVGSLRKEIDNAKILKESLDNQRMKTDDLINLQQVNNELLKAQGEVNNLIAKGIQEIVNSFKILIEKVKKFKDFSIKDALFGRN